MNAKPGLRRVGLRTLGIVGIVAVVGGIALGVRALMSREPGSTEATATTAGTGSPSTASGETGVFTADTLTWQQVPMPIRTGKVRAVVYGPAGFVAMGQDYLGAGNGSVTFLSEDGLVWGAGVSPAPDQSESVDDIMLAGDRYLVIGGTFSLNVAATPFLSTSTDGLGWVSTRVPIETQIELGGHVVDLNTWTEAIVAIDDRVAVFITQNVDPAPFYEDALGEDISIDLVERSESGVRFSNVDGDLVGRITWEEIGIGKDDVPLVWSGRPVLLTSTDLETWEQVTITGLGQSHWFDSLTTIGDSLVMLNGGPLLVSDDGAEWREIADPSGSDGSLEAVATFDDRVVIAVGSNSNSEMAAWSSTDLETWEPVDIPATSGELQKISVSEAGIAVLAWERLNAVVEIEVDGMTVVAPEHGAYTVLDTDGAEIAEIPRDSVRWADDGTISLLDPDTEEVLVTIVWRDIVEAWGRERERLEQQQQTSKYTLLVSRDGTNWTSHPLSDAIGDGFLPTDIAVGPNSIVVAGSDQDVDVAVNLRTGEGPSATVWVATP